MSDKQEPVSVVIDGVSQRPRKVVDWLAVDMVNAETGQPFGLTVFLVRDEAGNVAYWFEQDGEPFSTGDDDEANKVGQRITTEIMREHGWLS